MPDPIRQLHGQVGALVSWANTADRSARTRPAREAGPNGITYWVNKLDPEKFADATDAQKLAAADALKRAHFVRMAAKSAEVRRRKGVSPDDAA